MDMCPVGVFEPLNKKRLPHQEGAELGTMDMCPVGVFEPLNKKRLPIKREPSWGQWTCAP